MKNFCLGFLLVFFLFSCKEEKISTYTFYYWKTKLALTSTEKTALNEATSPYIYTRFFDVDKINGRLQTVASAVKDSSFATDKTIVPVVFITNRSFININNEEIRLMANRVNTLIKDKTKLFGFPESEEIQIDCDWTAGTREDFFSFLKILKSISGKNITSTLRLHQVKDKNKMGIPPVEKVYLMCYSTSSPLENSDRNSILDVGLLKNYLAGLQDYPIKNIDIALPIYSWGIVQNHIGKHKLINALNKKDLNHPNFRKISENEAEVMKEDFYFGHYLSKGFRIKVEEIEPEQLDEVLQFLNKKINGYNIVYYQLDEKFISNQIIN
ncbi:MAG: hypothetical protein Q4G16_01655 [Cruoricaptor ignavus]|nr:hypothetical protein [Cruoricaptor ignavus]